MATTASGLTIPGSSPTTTAATPIQDHWNNLGKSLNGRIVVPVASVTARAALVSALTAEGYTISASNPLYTHRADATVGSELEVTVNGTTWATVGRPRVGASVNLADSWTSTLTRVHAGSWSLGEDAGGFVGALTGNTTPIVIPTGKGGLYAVSLNFYNNVVVTARSYVEVAIGGTLLTGSRSNYRAPIPIGESITSTAFTIPLVSGCSLGVTSYLTNPAPYGVSATLSCYRIGD